MIVFKVSARLARQGRSGGLRPFTPKQRQVTDYFGYTENLEYWPPIRPCVSRSSPNTSECRLRIAIRTPSPRTASIKTLEANSVALRQLTPRYLIDLQ